MQMSHIQLVPQSTRPNELVEVLKGLLKMAEAGDVTGMVFGLSIKGHRYYFDAAGTMHRNPLLGIGAATKLAAELERRLDRQVQDTVF